MSILFLMILILGGCERLDWYQTLHRNTIPAYEHFIKKYDHSLRIWDAHDKLKMLHFEKAKHVNSIPAYEAFLKVYSYGALADSAKYHIERLAFQNTRRINTIPALQDFLRNYNPIFYADSVRNAIDHLYSQRHPDFRHVNTVQAVINYELGEHGVLNNVIHLPFTNLLKDMMSTNGITVTFDDIENPDMVLTMDVNSSIITSEQAAKDSLSSYGIFFEIDLEAQTPGHKAVTMHAVHHYFPERQIPAVSLANQSAFDDAFWQIGSFPTRLSTLVSHCFGSSGLISLLEEEEKLRPHIIQALILNETFDADVLSSRLLHVNQKNMAIAAVLARKDDKTVAPFLVEVLRSSNTELQLKAMELLKIVPDTSSITPLIALTEQRRNRNRCLRAIATLGYIQNTKSMQHLIQLLQDRDPDIRKAAVTALANYQKPTVVSSLIAMFDDEERQVANQSMVVLTEFGDMAVDSLIKALHDRETSTVWRAMVILGELGAERAVEHIIPLLNHTNSFTSWRAREILGQFKTDKVFQEMVQGLNDPEMTEKAAAVLGHLGDARSVQPLLQTYKEETALRAKTAIIRALGRLGDPRATELLLDILNSDQIVLQSEAARALGSIGDSRALSALDKSYQTDDFTLKMSILEAYGRYQQPKQTQRLLLALDEERSELRLKAVEMLAGLGELGIIDELVYRLDDPSQNVQDAVKTALATFGEAALPVMSNILQNHEERDLRLKIVYALREMPAELAVAPLISILDDPDPYFISNVKLTLQSLGEPAVSPLLNLLTSRNLLERSRSAEILAKMQEPRALPEMMDLLQGSNLSLKASAASLVGDLNYYPAVSLLIPCLNEKDMALVFEATKALGKIGSLHATPSLLKQLDSQNTNLVVETARALGRIQDSRSIPSLIEKTKSRNQQVKTAANDALVNIGAPAVDSLMPLMSDPNHFVIANTADILTRIGKPAVPALLGLLEDTSTTSWYAAEALGNIKDPRAIQPLIDSLTWDDGYFYRIVKTAIATFGEPAFEPVTVLLHSDNADLRWKAIEVMYAFNELSMIKYFIAALDDKSWHVRFTAAKILHNISGENYSMDVKKWRKWFNERWPQRSI